MAEHAISSPFHERAPWRRILYEKQAYKDNHFDPAKFFEQLTILRYGEYHKYSFFETVLHASLLAQQFSAVTFFLTVYRFILQDRVLLEHLQLLDAVALITGSIIFLSFAERQKADFWEFARVALLFLVCLRIAAPVIRTLTAAVSEDTIYATAILLSVVHLALHDYTPHLVSGNDSGSGVASSGGKDEGDAHFSGIISLNTAMFTAFILASRLHSPEMVVAFVVFAVISFTLFPICCRLLRDRHGILHAFFAVLQWIFTSVSVFALDETLFWIYELLMLMLWILGPALFLYMLRHKKVLRGPWDVASIG